MRDDIDDLSARLAETEASANTLPHRRKYLLLVVGFLRRQLELHLELVDEVERELDPESSDTYPQARTPSFRVFVARAPLRSLRWALAVALRERARGRRGRERERDAVWGRAIGLRLPCHRRRTRLG